MPRAATLVPATAVCRRLVQNFKFLHVLSSKPLLRTHRLDLAQNAGKAQTNHPMSFGSQVSTLIRNIAKILRMTLCSHCPASNCPSWHGAFHPPPPVNPRPITTPLHVPTRIDLLEANKREPPGSSSIEAPVCRVYGARGSPLNGAAVASPGIETELPATKEANGSTVDSGRGACLKIVEAWVIS